MITTKEIKIKRPVKFDADIIELELKNRGLNVLRWAITGYDDETYTLSIAFIED